MVLNCSHLVIAVEDVPKSTAFFEIAFEQAPYFSNDLFSEFVLRSGFRIAFFKPVGKAAASFSAIGSRDTQSFGITLDNVDDYFANIVPKLTAMGASVTGEPKEHPWGEKSFLLLDLNGNRWEMTQSPSKDGVLKNHP